MTMFMLNTNAPIILNLPKTLPATDGEVMDMVGDIFPGAFHPYCTAERRVD
jgi:hypothetical protein